jgi:hypothetical protein
MNPWLRDLVRTLAAVAVEEMRAFEGGKGAMASSGERPLTPMAGHGNVAGRGSGDAPAKRRGQVRKPRARE